MQRILNEVDTVLNEGMVQCVLAADEATHFATRDALIEQVKAMGMERVEECFVSSYNALMEQYKQFGSIALADALFAARPPFSVRRPFSARGEMVWRPLERRLRAASPGAIGRVQGKIARPGFSAA